MSAERQAPALGFIGPRGVGKTTLLRAVIEQLSRQGVRVGGAKQAVDMEIDQPGKDSHRLRLAGAERLLLTSSRKSALIIEHPDGDTPQLLDLLPLFDHSTLDIILAEGCNEQPFPKIELVRAGGQPRRYPHDPFVIALATDRPETTQAAVPVLDINDPAAVVEFVLAWLKKTMA